MPLRKPRNAHAQGPASPSSPLSSAPLTSTFSPPPSSTFSPASASAPASPDQSPNPISHSNLSSPYPPPLTTSPSLSTPRSPPFPSTPAQGQQDTFEFSATPPSGYIYHEQVRHSASPVGRYNDDMFDPFSSAPRPKRKPYSPYSAFESRLVQNGGQEERPTSMSSSTSAYSFEAESVVEQHQHQAVTVSHSVSHSHSQMQMHMHMSHGAEKNQQGRQIAGQKQGSKHRRSTLSFEIGGPEDETDTDREVSVPMSEATQMQRQQSATAPAQTEETQPQVQGEGKYLVARRPSTGDSSTPSSQDIEPNSDSHPSEDPASSAPETVEEREDAADIGELAPPRPRFVKENATGERASWSSQDSSLYPPSSAPNSDTEFVGNTGASDSEREHEARKASTTNARNAARAGRERANTAGAAVGGTHAPPAPRTHAYKRRSGSYSSMGNGPASVGGRALPPGAAPPSHMPSQGPQGAAPRPGPTPYPNTRRYSGGPHRRSGSFQNAAAPMAAVAAVATATAGVAALAPGEIEEIPRSESPSVANQATSVGVGPRLRGVAPPSAYRGSRTSFSSLPPGAAQPNVSTTGMNGGVAVPEDAHPLSPNSSYYNSPFSPSDESAYSPNQGVNGNWNAYGSPYANGNGEMTSSAGHGSFVSNGSGYQYPPSPTGAQQAAYTNGGQGPGQGQGQAQPIYPGGASYPGGGSGYPYANLPPGLGQPPINGIPPQGGGYATPTARVPAHNAFMANSAIARSSVAASASGSAVDLVPYAARVSGIAGAYGSHSTRNSVDFAGFAPPQPPFAQGGGGSGYPPASPGTPGMPELRHAGSLPRLREPFLSPASRRSSSVWAPPTPAAYTAGNVGYGDGHGSGFFGGYAYNGVGSGSNTMLALPGKKEPFPSSALRRKISVSEKPWVKHREKGERAAWWLTFCIMWIGVAIGAVVVFFGFTNVEKINSNLCSVLDDDFSSFNTDTWTKNISLGGFGNGEFQMTTDSSDNLYIKNGQLYIMPTLTSDEIGQDAIFNGHTYNLTGCTETWNASDCSVASNQGTNTVINPVKSARISTRDSVSIAYGKVEVVAKMPRGDWLWPGIWMLPKDEKYGAWPRSGEIDIVEARGNQPSYPEQGNNFVRASLNWGPLDSVIAFAFGWQSQKRSSYASGFHTYTLEWTPDFIRISVDTKLRAMLDLNIKKQSFFDRGGFPVTSQNGSTEAVVQDIWEGQPNSAPFDQEFYLIINLAVGGTTGWFPDNVGGKMWFDGSATAMTDFAKAQDAWFSTWPGSDDDRALRVDSVKMWKLC